MLDDSCDLDINFFDTDIRNIDTPYILPETFFLSTKFNMFLNLTSEYKKSQENVNSFKLFLSSLSFELKIICFSEKWLDDSALAWESLYKLLHQIRGHGKGGGVSIYTNESFSHRVRTNLSVNNNDVESLSIENFVRKKYNALINVLYRPPSDLILPLKNFLKDVFNKPRKF